MGILYQCPRCGYNTSEKNNMRKHLYKRVKPCPTNINDIELTEEIKQHILDFCVYHIKKEEPIFKTTNFNISTYNTLNNFVRGLDIMTKVEHVSLKENENVTAFDESLDQKYKSQIRYLEQNLDKGQQLVKKDDYINIFDEVTNMSNAKSIKNFNILYDDKKDVFLMYNDGTWNEYRIQKFVETVTLYIKDYYWSAYETYLIRRIMNSDDCMKRVKTREILEVYYTILASLDIPPFVENSNDNKIKFTPDDDEYWIEPDKFADHHFEIVEEYYNLYTKIKNNLSLAQKQKLLKELVDIAKRNSRNNCFALNKLVMMMINNDSAFKQKLIESAGFG